MHAYCELTFSDCVCWDNFDVLHVTHRNNIEQLHRDLHENIEKSKAVHSKVESVINMDDYALLKESSLTMDQIEGVFTNPPPTQPR